MQAMWQLAIGNLRSKPVRTTMLIGAIMAAVTLMIAMASMLATIDQSHQRAVGNLFGKAQIRLSHRFGQRLEQSLVQQVRKWPETKHASPVFNNSMSLRLLPREDAKEPNAATVGGASGEAAEESSGGRITLQVMGIEPEIYTAVHPPTLEEGRLVERENEIVLDSFAAKKIGAQVGDKLAVIRFGEPVTLTIVGLAEREKLDVLQQPRGMMMLAQAQSLGGLEGYIDTLDIELRSDVSEADIRQKYQKDLPLSVLMQTTATSAAGVSKALAGMRMMLLLITALVLICASFIIAASQTTALSQQTRELAILRCVGATRGQMASAQLLCGMMITFAGTLLGLPAGLGIAWGMYHFYQSVLTGGFNPAWGAVGVSLIAAVVCGLLAGAWPAVLAWRSSPTAGLGARAIQPSKRGVVVCLILGIVLVLGPMLALPIDIDAQTMFWFYPLAGMPLVLTGWFLLSIAMVVAVAWLVAWPLGKLLRLPGALVKQAILGSPYRQGLTAAALMVPLALLINIWTGGRSFLHGWFDELRIPDAFVHRATPIPESQLLALKTSPAVTRTCAITAFNVPSSQETQFGVKAYSPQQTLFVACEIASFFEMTDLKWVQGDAAAALARMQQGKAVLVSEEYRVVHGLGVGDKLTLGTVFGPREFEIAGVVSSPGLDVAVQFYGIGRAFTDASIGSVIGTRDDAREYWHVTAANLVLLSVNERMNDRDAMRAIAMAAPGTSHGSSRRIRHMVHDAAGRLMGNASAVALVGLIIASLGVANLIIAGLNSRSFEFGVFRAIGGSKAMLARLIFAQSLIVAITASIMGLGMGLQVTVIGQHIHRRLVGLIYGLEIPWDVAMWGTLAITTAAMLATLPAVVWLVRAPIRDLLASE